MTKHYLAMTPAEFEAHGDAIRKQIDRVHLRGLIYGALLLAGCIAALYVAANALSVPTWLAVSASLVLGIVAAKVGVWLSWRREGERPTWEATR